ncbi:DUF3422 domain-containing protein [Marivibrio halodurans]|uniref:DUF3422 domain-containing protein n=1 Tax=Marivibrio halodurans TaxID=2039722 RepID=A0A8J7SAJ4_9PROT|nr:DUF3422 domain-containing protein [Marivibrio halodurans]MBP5858502.1 DUF3422 domain-containing protein [Marivibrio halodurans]
MSDVGTAAAEPGHGVLPPTEHPLRYQLSNELHARPFEELTAPADIVLYAMVTGEGTAGDDRAHLTRLCDRFGINPPMAGANFFSADFGAFRLRWERHSEFTGYTVIRPRTGGAPFAEPAGNALPADWFEGLPGELLVATHLVLLSRDDPVPDQRTLERLFVPASLVTSLLAGGSAQVWTDLRIHPDGHNRILLRDLHMQNRKAGRVVQRLLEIATYRNVALLALPLARETSPRIARIDRALADLTAMMAETGAADSHDDGDLLERLTRQSAEIERLASETAYRFSAAKAYHALIETRLLELREEQIDGYQTIAEFLERRLGPAMRTCASVGDRLADLSRRATRAANLLRTRVDFALERQNQNLLHSMDRRAKLQLRLQQTVEGLSVAAISYYLIGLIGYATKALAKAGAPVDPTLATGVSVPFIVALLWVGMHRTRRMIQRRDEGREP